MPQRKLDSVLARFEQTIEQNNAAGVCSGMYLTNQASRNASPEKKHQQIVHHASSSPSKASIAGRRGSTSLDTSLQIQPGMYRNMLKKTDAATVSTADTAESNDWDPFNDVAAANGNNNMFEESFSSLGDASSASFHDDDVSEKNRHKEQTTTRRERPKERKSTGRRSTRITKSQKSRRESMCTAPKSSLEVMASLEDPETKEEVNTGDEDDDDRDGDDVDDDDDGFALTYVSAREKFTALARQNSDKQLSKQPSRRKLLLGLKMTSKENLMSGDSNHSSSSATKRNSLDRRGSDRSLGEKTPAAPSSKTRRASSNSLLDNNAESSRRVPSSGSPEKKMHRSTRVSASSTTSPRHSSRTNAAMPDFSDHHVSSNCTNPPPQERLSRSSRAAGSSSSPTKRSGVVAGENSAMPRDSGHSINSAVGSSSGRTSSAAARRQRSFANTLSK
jgi:hypothetical protein